MALPLGELANEYEPERARTLTNTTKHRDTMQLQKSHYIAVFVYSISRRLTLSVCFADSSPKVGAKGNYSTLVTL